MNNYTDIRHDITTLRYVTRDHANGHVIDEFDTKQEAIDAILEYAQEDREEGTYTPDFYEAYDTQENEVVETA